MNKKAQELRRKIRVRTRVNGTAERPRLTIKITNRNIIAQIINDDDRKTLVYATTIGQKNQGNLSKKAAILGEEIALKAGRAKLKRVVLDRGGHLYHKRLNEFATAARKAGLEF